MRKDKKNEPHLTVQISKLMRRSDIYDLVRAIFQKSQTDLPAIKTYQPFSVTVETLNIFFTAKDEEYIADLNDKLRKDDCSEMAIQATLISKDRKNMAETLIKTFSSSNITMNLECHFIVEFKRYSQFIFEAEKADSSNSDSDDDIVSKRITAGKAIPMGDAASSLRRKGSYTMDREERLQQTSRQGVVGLKNLGNTCYMNSALQCLSNTKELTQYFLNKEYLQDKNADNPLGSSCKLVEAYYRLINQLWYGDNEKYSPSDFKYEMGKFQPNVRFG